MLGAAMLVPFVTALIFQEYRPALIFLLSVGVTLIVGGSMRLMKVSATRISGRQAMIVTGLAWVFAALFSAIPLAFSGNYGSYLDAVFETVSGFTTTGMTLIYDVDHMAVSMNMWRFLTHLIGGQGVLLAAISIGLFGKGGGSAASALYTSEGRSDHILPNIQHTVSFIWRISAIVIALGTLATAVAALFAGLTPLRAVLHGFWLTIAAFDTGGFAPQTMSMMHYHSLAMDSVVTVIAFVGMLNFVIYALAARGGLKEIFKNIEMQTLAIWVSAVTVLCVLALASTVLFSSWGAMVRRGLFMIVSAESTTGFSFVYTSQLINTMPAGAVFAIILAMTMGGASGSTAGGIKAMRIGVIVKALVQSIKNVLLPDSAVSNASYHHITRQPLTSDLTSASFTITIIFIFSYIIGGVAGIVLGYDAIPALFDSVSSASNVGLSMGVATATAPAVLKVIYIVQMLTGRLEFIAFFAMIYVAIISIVPKRNVDNRG